MNFSKLKNLSFVSVDDKIQQIINRSKMLAKRFLIMVNKDLEKHRNVFNHQLIDEQLRLVMSSSKVTILFTFEFIRI